MAEKQVDDVLALRMERIQLYSLEGRRPGDRRLSKN